MDRNWALGGFVTQQNAFAVLVKFEHPYFWVTIDFQSDALKGRYH